MKPPAYMIHSPAVVSHTNGSNMFRYLRAFSNANRTKNNDTKGLKLTVTVAITLTVAFDITITMTLVLALDAVLHTRQ